MGSQATFAEPTILHHDPQRAGHPLKVLMIGYNGANNTGAEALLLSDLEDLRAVLPTAHVTVPTLNETNLRRYLREDAQLRIAPIGPLGLPALRRLAHEHDLVMLVEGSCYMDTWGSPLLWEFLWTTACAHEARRPVLAYAVDAGRLSHRNQWLLRRRACQPDLIITRARAAAERMRAWGVEAPMEVTADNALTFRTSASDDGWVRRAWPEASAGIVGIAAMDFNLFPVVMRPWGRAADCYRWPYYFSRSRQRRRASEELARGYAGLADDIIARYGKRVALIGMEGLDEPLAHAILGHMTHRDQARVFSSRQYDASQMTVLLRSLDLLVTSRYHAAILSLAAQVPQVAVGHDLRLLTLHQEVGLGREFFIASERRDMLLATRARVAQLMANPETVRRTLCRGHAGLLARACRNRALLQAFVQAQSYEEAAWAA